MKRFIVIVPILLVLISESAFSQATCSLECCNQCFPYNFCTDSGMEYVMCSNAPNEDGIPAKSWIPSCVEVDAMRLQGMWMPQTDVPDFTEMPPTPPDKEEIWERYVEAAEDVSYYDLLPPPWSIPYSEGDNAAEYWYSDPTTPDAGLTQWNLDSTRFFAGLGWELMDTSTLDENAIDAAGSYFEQDYGWLFEEYDHEESAYTDSLTTYETDSTTHFTGHDVPYTQIWNQTNADTDANDALQHWLNQCSPPIPPTGILTGCCLHIVLDTVAADFDDPLNTYAETVNNLGGLGFPTCSETVCPYFARYVNVNTSSAFFYASNIPREQHPDTSYILHSVPKWSYYTSQTSAPFIFTGFNAVSFYQLMEHEIGHFLGMLHPNQLDTLHHITCSNCYTMNPAWITDSLGDNVFRPTGFQTVMMPFFHPNQPPLLLTNEDECQFQKLYCPGSCITHGGSCALDGVGQSAPVQDWFNPEVFPNPTSGGMTLTYTLTERSLTQITIYDVLGNQVRFVSSGYEEEGQVSISLGTESLPSGNYVCRVRVGDRVSYINLAITK